MILEASLEPLRVEKDEVICVKHDDGGGAIVQSTHGTYSCHLEHEAYQLLYISLPAVAVNLCVRLIFPQTASAVGRILGVQELAACSLGSLTANLTCQSIIMGALTAAETPMPRAFGSGEYIQVGHFALQGCLVCTVLLFLPMLLLCTNMMERLFQIMGQDVQVSVLAAQWIYIYLLVIPYVLLLTVESCRPF